jgi:hypothetical protein
MRTAMVGFAPFSLLSRSAMPGIFASRAINSSDNCVSLPLSGPSSESATGRLF